MTRAIETDGEATEATLVDSATPPRGEHLSVAERTARGRAERSRIPREAHAALELPPGRDPVALLEQQAATRVPELVPIRYGRMLASPFAFYRGGAALMAGDLAPAPRTGLRAQLCGDAHLANFGGFASPERDLVFDLNDFDETLPGPFEWDVKRLATSFEVAGRERDLGVADRRTAVVTSIRSYREAMREFSGMSNLGVWYTKLDVSELAAMLRKEGDKKGSRKVEGAAAKARTKDSLKAFSRLTVIVDGEPRIAADPPLLVPLADLDADGSRAAEVEAAFHDLIRTYRRSLQRERRALLEGYRYADLARKVVGVGSVGTRDWILLLLGRDEGDPLFLQIKEAGPSVLEPVLGRSQFENHGQRIVEGQRLMQAASDIFLGWIRSESKLDGVVRDFSIRQLWDWKLSDEPETASARLFALYAQVCGATLARAHARSGDRIAIGAYLGKNEAFDLAVAEFASAYADLNQRDYKALRAAVDAGRIAATEGL